MDPIEEAKKTAKERLVDYSKILPPEVEIDEQWEEWAATLLNILSDSEVYVFDDHINDLLGLIKYLLNSHSKRVAQSVLIFMCVVGRELGRSVVEEILNGEKEVKHRKLLKSLLGRL